MVNYQLGKIYKIVNDVNDNFYIGNTAEKNLSNRMATHRRNNDCMSKSLGVDLKECNIILIENYPCNDKQELRRREREYFDKYKKECKEVFLNKNRPIRLEGEEKIIIRNQKKEYYEKNKKIINEKKKEIYEKNKKTILKKRKEYVNKNKQIISNKQKEYYEKNKDKISEKQKEKITCDCGCLIRKDGLKEHKKTKKHIKLMNLLQ